MLSSCYGCGTSLSIRLLLTYFCPGLRGSPYRQHTRSCFAIKEPLLWGIETTPRFMQLCIWLNLLLVAVVLNFVSSVFLGPVSLFLVLNTDFYNATLIPLFVLLCWLFS